MIALYTAVVMRTTWDKPRTAPHQRWPGHHPRRAGVAAEENACNVNRLWPPQREPNPPYQILAHVCESLRGYDRASNGEGYPHCPRAAREVSAMHYRASYSEMVTAGLHKAASGIASV